MSPPIVHYSISMTWKSNGGGDRRQSGTEKVFYNSFLVTIHYNAFIHLWTNNGLEPMWPMQCDPMYISIITWQPLLPRLVCDRDHGAMVHRGRGLTRHCPCVNTTSPRRPERDHITGAMEGHNNHHNNNNINQIQLMKATV